MRTVWKFPLALASGQQQVIMPVDADIKHVNAQIIAGQPCVVMWAEVDSAGPKVERAFHVLATGEPITISVYSYVGTAHIDWTVWHVYEDR